MLGDTSSPTEAMSNHVKTIQHRIATLAEYHAKEGLSSIHHHLDKWWLAETYRELKPNKAPGLDGVSKAEYGVGLSQRLEDLVNRVRKREYRAPNIKRVMIPKGNGEFRPLGLLNMEDKVLQKGFVMLVEPVFEREFYDFSYGFRPGRSPHQALGALRRYVGEQGLYWVIDLDLRKYFDTIPHLQLREMFSRRIRDGVLNRLVLGWLKAGVLHEGKVTISEEGTPQGGIVSPLLSNLYLHEALDHWFVQEVQPRLKGAAQMVRFADDAVLCFQRKEDAQQVLEELGKRMTEYGLKLHPEKTKLVDFRPPDWGQSKGHGSLNFLGFCFYWARTRNGRAVVKLKTARDRLTRKIKETGEWLRDNRHEPVAEQHAQLSAKIRGHLQYYGVSFNSRSLGNFVWEVTRRWRRWLARRGGKRYWSWERMKSFLVTYPLPQPRIVHRLFA
jgi:group II intron reverse transcriptase/maturase